MRDRLNGEPLTSIVALLRPRTVLSKVVSGAGRWAVRYASFGHPSFCLMLTGSCWLSVDGATTMSLEPGDFVLLPATPGFSLASDRDALGNPIVVAAEPGSTRERRHGDATGEATMRMLGGYFVFDPANAALLLGLLPTWSMSRHRMAGLDRLAWIVKAIRDETSAATARWRADPGAAGRDHVDRGAALATCRRFSPAHRPPRGPGRSAPVDRPSPASRGRARQMDHCDPRPQGGHVTGCLRCPVLTHPWHAADELPPPLAHGSRQGPAAA